MKFGSLFSGSWVCQVTRADFSAAEWARMLPANREQIEAGMMWE